MRASLIVAVLMLTGGVAWAQSASALGPPPPAAEGRSPGVGVGLAVAGTIIPAVGFGIGLAIDDRDTATRVVLISLVGGIVMPSAGLAYGGKKKSFGLVPRTAAVLTLGIAALFDGLDEDEGARQWYAAAGVLYVLGAGIDIAMTPAAVRDYNARKATEARVSLAPVLVPGGGGVAIGGHW